MMPVVPANLKCDSCDHDWHGLRCTAQEGHDQYPSCGCPGPFNDQDMIKYDLPWTPGYGLDGCDGPQ